MSLSNSVNNHDHNADDIYVCQIHLVKFVPIELAKYI